MLEPQAVRQQPQAVRQQPPVKQLLAVGQQPPVKRLLTAVSVSLLMLAMPVGRQPLVRMQQQVQRHVRAQVRQQPQAVRQQPQAVRQQPQAVRQPLVGRQ